MANTKIKCFRYQLYRYLFLQGNEYLFCRLEPRHVNGKSFFVFILQVCALILPFKSLPDIRPDTWWVPDTEYFSWVNHKVASWPVFNRVTQRIKASPFFKYEKNVLLNIQFARYQVYYIQYPAGYRLAKKMVEYWTG